MDEIDLAWEKFFAFMENYMLNMADTTTEIRDKMVEDFNKRSNEFENCFKAGYTEGVKAVLKSQQ